jgi:hypothetical protein
MHFTLQSSDSFDAARKKLPDSIEFLDQLEMMASALLSVTSFNKISHCFENIPIHVIRFQMSQYFSEIQRKN